MIKIGFIVIIIFSMTILSSLSAAQNIFKNSQLWAKIQNLVQILISGSQFANFPVWYGDSAFFIFGNLAS